MKKLFIGIDFSKEKIDVTIRLPETSMRLSLQAILELCEQKSHLCELHT